MNSIATWGSIVPSVAAGVGLSVGQGSGLRVNENDE